jgi:arylsulfatase
MRRMAVYAAQVEILDQNVGKIVSKLRELGILDNTLIFFMADNGGNYEEIAQIMPGPSTTYASYGIPWGNCSNTPFRMYKHYAHEGGISTPFIAHWPKGISRPAQVTAIGHEIDVMPTCLEVAKAAYPPVSKAGVAPPPFEGQSLTPVFHGGGLKERPLFWEHEGNCAVRTGQWKLVSRYPDAWELYDMEADRTEMHDLADLHPERVKSMAAEYEACAHRVGAAKWPMPETPANQRVGGLQSPAYLQHDRP